MATTNSQNSSSEHELVLIRMIDAFPDKVFRAWTEPELLKQWFVPPPLDDSFC